jgi:GDPmannose 4,6-dehydratase
MQSFYDPTYTLRVNAESPIAFFEAIQRWSPKTRVYFAGTSEMFGGQPPGTARSSLQDFEPHSPYGVAKCAAFLAARLYRQLGLFVVGGVGFNHESCRRGANFVTRKIGLGLQEYKRTGKPVLLGTASSCRDWHHAKDTAQGMWLSLQQKEPGEYIFASGVARSVAEFAMDLAGVLNIGHPERALVFDEFGEFGKKRPWEVPYLCGDPSETERLLGWKRAMSYEDLLLDVSKE